MNTLFMAPTEISMPRGLVVPQVSGDLLVKTAEILHQDRGSMTVADLAERLDRDPRTARFAMVASGAMGVVRTRFLPSPRRLIAETGFQQRHAFSVRNETVARIKDYPFMKSFRIMGAGYVENTLRRDYGLSGTTVNRRVRAIGSLAEYAEDYVPVQVDTLLDSTFTEMGSAPRPRAERRAPRWADTGRPSARLMGDSDDLGGIRVVKASERRQGAGSALMNVDMAFTTATIASLTSNVCPSCFMARAANGMCSC